MNPKSHNNMEKIYYIQSEENPWRIWVTKNINQKEHERFRDSKNNYPFIIPPTTGDRIDIYQTSDIKSLYQLGFTGCVVVIKSGKISLIQNN